MRAHTRDARRALHASSLTVTTSGSSKRHALNSRTYGRYGVLAHGALIINLLIFIVVVVFHCLSCLRHELADNRVA